MLRLNKNGIISWLLSQLALLLATAILLASIASITFYNDWKKEGEIKALAMNIASEIASMDLKSYPNSTDYFLPMKPYKIYLSTEYVRIVRNDGTINKNISVVVHLLIKPFISAGTLPWKNGDELHNYLLSKYGYSGNASDPFPSTDKEKVKNYLKDELDHLSKNLAINPFCIDVDKPLHIEKDCIYFKNGEELENIGILIINQEEK